MYVPLGVVLPGDPPPLSLGISREAPQPPSATTAQASTTSAALWDSRGPSNSSPNGVKAANHIIRLCPGHFTAAPATLVATVTVITVVPPSATLAGFTTHVACAGAPVHVSAAVPGTPAADVNRSPYTACDPAASVCVVLPLDASAKSTPTPDNGIVCGDPGALSVTVNAPFLEPPAAGVNTICAAHDEPTASVAPHVLLPATNPKSPLATSP